MGDLNARYEILYISRRKVANMVTAIDHISKQKHDMQRLSDMQRDTSSVRRDFEKARQENSMLREEVHSLWQNLRRVEPNSQHVYGPYTSQLVHEGPQTQAPP